MIKALNKVFWSGFVYGAALGSEPDRVIDLGMKSADALSRFEPGVQPGAQAAEILQDVGWELNSRDESTRGGVLGLLCGLGETQVREAADLAEMWGRSISHNHGLDFTKWCASACVLAKQGEENERILQRACRGLIGSELPMIVKDLRRGLHSTGFLDTSAAIKDFYQRYTKDGDVNHALPNFGLCAAAMMHIELDAKVVPSAESAEAAFSDRAVDQGGMPEMVVTAGLDSSGNAAILGALEALVRFAGGDSEVPRYQAEAIERLGRLKDVDNLVEKVESRK